MPISLRLLAAIVALTITIAGAESRARATSQIPNGAPGVVHPNFAEPVVLSSVHGVLEVTLTAHQSYAHLDTVVRPVSNFLTFAYHVERGSASDGHRTGDEMYPAPTLRVAPGETLIVHLNNALAGLRVPDFYDPAYTRKGGSVPVYPPQLTSSPFNLHVHGLHVSPKGNGDNVLLDIQAGMSNTYVYRVPADAPQGAYWYHSHLHTLTAPQTYMGLAGVLEIGRLDGNIPLVSQRKIPIRNMILQYNDVFDRSNGLAQLDNINWAQYVSTLATPTTAQLAAGTYRPLLAPVNFGDAKRGTRFATVWYSGPLSTNNLRGLFQFVPSNLQTFTASGSRRQDDIAAQPELPDAQRDVQFTVNGQFEPTIADRSGQTEIWVLSNLSDFAYENIQLTETASGAHPRIEIVGEDGIPGPTVHEPPSQDPTRLLVPPASRIAIAVTMPQTGDLVLSMPPLPAGLATQTAPGVAYTNNGTANPPAVLGTISVSPTAISYQDGFFVFPTQELLRATTSAGPGVTTSFRPGQLLHARTSFFDASHASPSVTRTFVIGGGFLNQHANPNDPKAFVYAFDGNAFPYVPLVQPRLGTIEQWNFINQNNDQHPIHIHVNDFQVQRAYDPVANFTYGPTTWGNDSVNVPAPLTSASGSLLKPGQLSLRTKFENYTGVYVMHCHRLNHEDNGLMAAINVIPRISAYAVGEPGVGNRPATVRIYDGDGDRLMQTVTPFPHSHSVPSVAMGDIEGDGVLDLIVATGTGSPAQVAVYSGTSDYTREVLRFRPPSGSSEGAISVAAAQIDGTSADNIILGSGRGAIDRVTVFGSSIPQRLGSVPTVFSSFAPFAHDRSGVIVAAGMVDLMSGRYSIVATPKSGAPGIVKVFRLWLLKPIPHFPSQVDAEHMHQDSQGPVVTASFAPFGSTYRGGISLAVGWVTGPFGGAQSIVASQQQGDSVGVFSAGTGLHGLPAIYLKDPQSHDYAMSFKPFVRFHPIATASDMRVATTATTTGADLLLSVLQNGRSSLLRYRLERGSPASQTIRADLVRRIVSGATTTSSSIAGN